MAPTGVTTVATHHDHSGPQRMAEDLWPPKKRSANHIASLPRTRCWCISHPVPPSSSGPFVQSTTRAHPRTLASGQNRDGTLEPTPHMATPQPVAAVVARPRCHATGRAGTVCGAAQPPPDTPPVCPSPHASGAGTAGSRHMPVLAVTRVLPVDGSNPFAEPGGGPEAPAIVLRSSPIVHGQNHIAKNCHVATIGHVVEAQPARENGEWGWGRPISDRIGVSPFPFPNGAPNMPETREELHEIGFVESNPGTSISFGRRHYVTACNLGIRQNRDLMPF